jgi:hypothetical protein
LTLTLAEQADAAAGVGESAAALGPTAAAAEVSKVRARADRLGAEVVALRAERRQAEVAQGEAVARTLAAARIQHGFRHGRRVRRALAAAARRQLHGQHTEQADEMAALHATMTELMAENRALGPRRLGAVKRH